MLERIEEVQGIGLLHHAIGKSHTCHKATLIYSDNGRGKSTLASALMSAATKDATLIQARRTIDGTLPPKVVLQFHSGHKVSFENGVWSEQRPELLVFDAEFVGRNVHSGGSVSTDHRKNLLEFALGEAAVAARAAVEKATNESKAATDTVQGIVGQLSGYHSGLTLTQFEQLPQIADIDAKIAELQKRLSAAGNVATIQAKPIPNEIVEPSFDIDRLFTVCGLSLKDIHTDAEKLVKQHIAKLGGRGAESWLSQGRQFGTGGACPFCDQDISSNDLVRAYQTHFNVAYADLKATIAVLQSTVAASTAASIVDTIAHGVGVATAQVSAWTEQVSTQPIAFDSNAAHTALGVLREFVGDLCRSKLTTPAEALGSSEEKTRAAALWQQVLIPIRAVNAAINTAAGLIRAYKVQLTGDSIPELQRQIQHFQATKRRYDPKAVQLVEHIATARKAVEVADRTKKAARDSLDGLMVSTLTRYQASINALLKNFGASFSIQGMSANFRGNAPRSEYGLLLRGKTVALEGGPPSFATALSEGDKRTLGFAFFIASTLEDKDLATKTVIIDDPMCSLDMNRRQHTRTVLRRLYSKAAQIMVLAHDPYFLRDLRDTLRKEDKAAPIAGFQLVAVPNNYTDFAALDLDKECESTYFRHHRLLNECWAGKGGDPKAVAKAIRPLLEGYLHRRFPGQLPMELMFGQVIALIRDSVAPSPLCHAKNIVDELNEINDFAGQFHHDNADTVAITVTELQTFVGKALSVVYKGAPP